MADANGGARSVTGLDGQGGVARLLVSTGAVAFRTDPFFTFTSGVESPVYVDNRRLLGHVDERREVVERFVATLLEVRGRQFGGIAGTATAGIPWAAWIADRQALPMLYVRSQAKEWGHQRAVEGTAPKGSRVAVVEDLAFTAGSLASSTEQLRRSGYEVDLALTIVSYETPGASHRVADLGLVHHSLTTIDQAVQAAVELGSLSLDQASLVETWLDNMRAPAQAS